MLHEPVFLESVVVVVVCVCLGGGEGGTIHCMSI